MIKAEDIQIGDFLRVNKDVCIKKNTIVKVMCIDGDNRFEEMEGSASCVDVNDKYMRFRGGVWCDYLDPIPLTDEIIEKNGFKNIKERIDNECDSFSSLFELNEDVVLGKHEDLYEVCHEKWNGDWDVYDHHPVFLIRHLHELQHTIKLLRIEKEIEP